MHGSGGGCSDGPEQPGEGAISSERHFGVHPCLLALGLSRTL